MTTKPKCSLGWEKCPFLFGDTEEDKQLEAFGHWLESQGQAWMPLAEDVIGIIKRRQEWKKATAYGSILGTWGKVGG